MTPEMRALRLAEIKAQGAYDFACSVFDHARVTLELAKKAVVVRVEKESMENATGYHVYTPYGDASAPLPKPPRGGTAEAQVKREDV